MSFDFFEMLPPHLRADAERHKADEAERLEHAKTCTATFCDMCRRTRCAAEGCGLSAFRDGHCVEHARSRRAAERAAAFTELVAAQVPEAFRKARLDAPWLASLVGNVAMLDARAQLKAGWATLYSSRTGAGKTSLAAAMVIERGRQDVLWVTARQLASAGAYAKLGEEPALLVAAKAAGLLVVDELGTEADRFGSAVADVIMDRHDLGPKAVWVTTPLKGETLSARYGSGFTRRLSENGVIVRVGAGQ